MKRSSAVERRAVLADEPVHKLPRQPYDDELDEEILDFYRDCLRALYRGKVPFLVGGACALAHYAGVMRNTHDLDVFVRRKDCKRALQALSGAGYHAHLTFPHWLGKAMLGDGYVDVIFSSGNGIVNVDDEWFEHAVPGIVLGLPVGLCPPEEIIWSKSFIMERERCDAADVAHILQALAPSLDWRRLIDRFGEHWRVLLGHLVLYDFVYPSERKVPAWVMRELLGRAMSEIDAEPAAEKLCQGTLLSRGQYLVDVDHWGYEDARLVPRGTMTQEDVAWWTACISRK